MNWLERYYKNKEKLIDANLYNPSQEHDACGVDSLKRDRFRDACNILGLTSDGL